jgi:aspartyl-tRNA(Asn)/glutamyl-tRNA(Gln) amidotransferase subunit A
VSSPLTVPPWQLSAGELAEQYRAARLTPSQALESILQRIAQVNPLLNAIVTLDQTGARLAAAQSTERFVRGQPVGDLDGIPVTIKDNLEVAGMRCTWGSRLFADHVPLEDELPVARLRTAGAVILGKTNCSEFAMLGHTDNLLFGATRNPWDTRLSAGGSSGGAVSAVAAGMGPIALGTDGGGSTRRPAAHTGLVGFKPSRGRLARRGGLPAIFMDYEVIGPIARTVGDALLLARALSAPHPQDPASWAFRGRELRIAEAPGSLRVLYIQSFGQAPVDREIAEQLDAAAARLQQLGHRVSTLQSWNAADDLNEHWMRLAQVGLARLIDTRQADPALLTELSRQAVSGGRAHTGAALFGLFETVAALSRALGELFDQYDVMLTPATAAWPWPVEQMFPARIDGRPVGPRGHAVFTAFVNAAGLPAVALPCGRSRSGLPNGMQCVARWGDDALLGALAHQWESAYAWRHHWPDLLDAGT